MRPDHRKLVGVVGIVGLLGAGAGAGYTLARLNTSEAGPQIESTETSNDQSPKVGSLTVSPEQIGNADISLQTVALTSIEAEIVAQAAVIAAPSGAASLTAHVSGTVTRIFKRVGEYVRSGDVLAIVEGQDAAQIVADRTVASTKANLAKRAFAREQFLFEQGVTPKAEYEQAEAEEEAASAELSRAQKTVKSANITNDGRGVAIVSPINGAISETFARLGMFVQPDTELFRVSDPKQMEIEASIPADDIGLVSVGDTVLLDVAGKGVSLGKVRSITPSLNTTTRAATAIIDAPGAELRAGQTLLVRIVSQKVASKTAISVPNDAIQTMDGHQIVFVRTETGFVAKPVLLGRQGASRTEVLRGLRENDRIAVRNAFVLKAELGKSVEED